jgi:hypothetical protein
LKNRPPLVWELPPDELAGTSGARLFYALSVGKANSPKHPYCVANEKITSELGRAIGLRIPEVLLYPIAGKWHAFSRFVAQTESGETVPEGTASEIEEFYERTPAELHGMVCFDLFVCNNDRKTDNLVIGESGKVWLIDHANALFYRPTLTIVAGIPRLLSVEANLAAMFDRPHQFLTALSSLELVDMWCERISLIPSYFIESIINNLPEEILSAGEREGAYDFLENRKKHMREIITTNGSLFPQLSISGE